MYSFQVNSFGAAVVLSALFMGLLGVVVIAPTAFIEFTWNCAARYLADMPLINPWQALLVYLACAAVIYLCGWIRIEVKTGSWE